MSKKLLIVDDDLPFRERLTRSMEKKGFEVVSSPGFKDSLNKVNDNDFDYYCSKVIYFDQQQFPLLDLNLWIA